MRRRRDQGDAGGRMAQLGDKFGDLEAGQLAALAGLGALGDLDLDLLAGAEIFRGHAKAARGDLLDRAGGIVAIFERGVAALFLAAFAGDGFRADPVHRDRQRFVRLGAERAEAHARRVEPLAHLGDRLDLVDGHRHRGIVEFHQVAQIDRFQLAHRLRELQVGGIAVMRDRGLQQVHQMRAIGMGLTAIALFVEAADRQADDRRFKGSGVFFLRVDKQGGIALAGYLGRHAGEQVVAQGA